MSAREWANNNPTMLTVGTIAVLLLALGAVYLQVRTPQSGFIGVYFYDLETQETFHARSDRIPPIEAPSGGEGVRAHLFSCGACEPGEWRGYLERFTEEYHAVLGGDGEVAWRNIPPPERPGFVEANHYIRDLAGGDWVRKESRAGQALRAQVQAECEGGTRPVECRP